MRKLLPLSALLVLLDVTPLPDATWGLHLTDANIALGTLAGLGRHQISVYERG